MKTIKQLLELNQNPHYTFTSDERKALDDFLSQKRDSASKESQKKNTNESSQKMPVTVRNIVPKTNTYPPVADESSL